MEIKKIDGGFSVCKITDIGQADFTDEFCFVGKTDEELSLVCRSERAPENVACRVDGWKAFRVEGVLDFSLIGILAEISSILAEEKISIFVVSTYNTDYVLTKETEFERALLLLEKKGYCVK